MNNSPFSTLGLDPDLLGNLESLGYHLMTPVQAQSLPPILAGRDVIAQAMTGSGKTAAFGLGLLQHLDTGSFDIQALVLSPTRELAEQVTRELRRLARARHNTKILNLSGGLPIGPQIDSLSHGAHVVVGTPGRLVDHLRKRTLELARVRTLVLDEADRMLDMGFQESLDAILARVPEQRQTLLFSATYPGDVDDLARRVTRDPERVEVQDTHDSSSIRQHFYGFGANKHRMTALRLVLLARRPASTLVFCATRRETEEVARELRSQGFSAIALHGEMDQRARDQALVRFANRSASILVATDVAARGLDIDDLDAVVNYQLARDPDVHVHRIGRTGRAGKRGLAITLFSDKEVYRLERLESVMEQAVEPEDLPPYSLLEKAPGKPTMVTLQIDGGRKNKLRPGDILGALTGHEGIAGKQVGKIDIFDHCAYVAVHRDAAKAALRKLGKDRLKGRQYRVRRI